MKIVGVQIPPPAPAPRSRGLIRANDVSTICMQVTETSAEGLEARVQDHRPGRARSRTRSPTGSARSAESVRIPGFRPGKVPMPLLRKRYGPAVRGEVLESTVQDSSAEAIRERNLRPALPPQVEIVSAAEGADLEYKMSLEVLPDMPAPRFRRSRHRKAGRRGARGGYRPGDRADRRAAAQVRAGRAPGRERRHPGRRCRRPCRRRGDPRQPRRGSADRARRRAASCPASRSS